MPAPLVWNSAAPSWGAIKADSSCFNAVLGVGSDRIIRDTLWACVQTSAVMLGAWADLTRAHAISSFRQNLIPLFWFSEPSPTGDCIPCKWRCGKTLVFMLVDERSTPPQRHSNGYRCNVVWHLLPKWSRHRWTWKTRWNSLSLSPSFWPSTNSAGGALAPTCVNALVLAATLLFQFVP